ncbi:MAG TPA: ATP-dependent RecD-like DNA helicase [Acholeplasma sp.]|jgi:exodeoxyribonuclease V alpha subunit|nr:ATP-dependent RecD-like DNA helicase [Acholeplasma sp.]
MDVLRGRIISYVFRNNDNGYVIARIEDESQEKQTIVGYLPTLNTSVFYDFFGEWIEHQKFGRQFKVESFKSIDIEDREGLITYLSSEFFTGVGPKTAEKIVDTLGMDAIEKIKKDKNILKEIGFNALKIERFYYELLANEKSETILVALYGYGIIGKTAMKILNKYSLRTLEQLEKDPYQLIQDIEGIGFLRADEIARKIGIDKHDIRRIKAAILYAMYNLAFQNGHLYLTKDQLVKYTFQVLEDEFDIDDAMNTLILEKRIIVEEERLYLPLAYDSEVEVAVNINRIRDTKRKLVDKDQVETLIFMIELQKNMTYTDMQKQAIIESLSNKFSIITGGPGTGKTTIIDGILDIYKNIYNLNKSDANIYEKIALMAPTGRAAKRMKELLDMEAQTIHRHLGYGYDGVFAYDQYHQLPHDLIIIDEASMIDIFLARRLFEAIKSDAQVIIVGDVDQLPSVGPGQVLSDLIQSNTIHTTRLNEIHRQAKDSQIVSLAASVNQQDVQHYDLRSENDVYMYRAEADEISNIIIRQIEGALKEGYDLIEDIQVLIPQYKGTVGIDNMNTILQDKFNQNKMKQMTYGSKVFYEGDKVIQLQNDPLRMIMNGDIGYISRIGIDQNGKEFMVVTFDDNEVLFEKSDLENLSLAYAMSVHKSQGSEYKIVILPLVRAYMHMLKKELLYTAITRAKKYLIILGDIKLLSYAANHLSDLRQTTLRLRLQTEDIEESRSVDTFYDEVSPYDF